MLSHPFLTCKEIVSMLWYYDMGTIYSTLPFVNYWFKSCMLSFWMISHHSWHLQHIFTNIQFQYFVEQQCPTELLHNSQRHLCMHKDVTSLLCRIAHFCQKNTLNFPLVETIVFFPPYVLMWLLNNFIP